jgi:hypothetical protein
MDKMNNESSIGTSVKKDIPSNDDIIRQYINPGEIVVGFGIGGSESLTIFIKKPGSTNTIVRKILSENLITAKWDRDGADVMLAPYKKAKQQAIYLKNLPESVKPYFPYVSDIIERKVPKSNVGDFKCNSRSPELVNELIYEMSYIHGDEVSEFIRKHNPPVEAVARLYVIIYQVLNSTIHINRIRKPSGPTLEQSYFRKIEKRLEWQKSLELTQPNSSSLQ